MDKIKICINGKTFEAEGDSLMDMLNHFLSGFDVEDDEINVPEPYKSYVDYLSLNDLIISKCVNKEYYDDLINKLNKRIEWAKKYSVDYTEVDNNLKNTYNFAKTFRDDAKYIEKACEAVMQYYNDIKKIKNNED